MTLKALRPSQADCEMTFHREEMRNDCCVMLGLFYLR